jgi:hypothetical protein
MPTAILDRNGALQLDIFSSTTHRANFAHKGTACGIGDY